MHFCYFRHTCDCVICTSLDGPSHCGLLVPVAQVMVSGTKWLTFWIFGYNKTSGFNDLLDFPKFEFIKLFYAIQEIEPSRLSQWSLLLTLYAIDIFQYSSVVKPLQSLWFWYSHSSIVRTAPKHTISYHFVYYYLLDCLDPTKRLLRSFQMSMVDSRSFQVFLTDFWFFQMRLTVSQLLWWLLGF